MHIIYMRIVCFFLDFICLSLHYYKNFFSLMDEVLINMSRIFLIFLCSSFLTLFYAPTLGWSFSNGKGKEKVEWPEDSSPGPSSSSSPQTEEEEEEWIALCQALDAIEVQEASGVGSSSSFSSSSVFARDKPELGEALFSSMVSYSGEVVRRQIGEEDIWRCLSEEERRRLSGEVAQRQREEAEEWKRFLWFSAEAERLQRNDEEWIALCQALDALEVQEARGEGSSSSSSSVFAMDNLGSGEALFFSMPFSRPDEVVRRLARANVGGRPVMVTTSHELAQPRSLLSSLLSHFQRQYIRWIYPEPVQAPSDTNVDGAPSSASRQERREEDEPSPADIRRYVLDELQVVASLLGASELLTFREEDILRAAIECVEQDNNWYDSSQGVRADMLYGIIRSLGADSRESLMRALQAHGFDNNISQFLKRAKKRLMSEDKMVKLIWETNEDNPETLRIQFHNDLFLLPSVPLSITLKDICFSFNGLRQVPNLKGLSFLETLDLSHNWLEALPELRELPRLRDLSLSHNRLSEARGLGELTLLSRLGLSHNQLSEVPGLERLTRLSRLDLSHNQLEALPELGELANLLFLTLSHNLLDALPELERLTDLLWLELSCNNLSGVPLEGLTRLSRLDLSHNQLEALPELGELVNLYSLILSHNQLSEVPELGKLTRLETLDLSHNQLSEVRGLGKLTRLSRLDLSHNRLPKVRGLGKLTRLSRLDLSHNQLSEVERLGELTGLSHLDLSHNQLAALPFFYGLTSLIILNVGHNSLSEMPSISHLSQLKELNISSNRLVEMPWLWSLDSLEQLNASGNQLRGELIMSFRLTRLQALNLSHNRLEAIGSGFSGHSSLTQLDISDNQLRELPTLARLTNLERLDVSRNALEEVPEFPTSLRKLNLARNCLGSRSSRFGHILPPIFDQTLPKLDCLDLSSNSLALPGYFTLIGLCWSWVSQNIESILLWRSDSRAAQGNRGRGHEPSLSQRFPRLTTLDLSHNDCGEEVIPLLSGLPRILFLTLFDNPRIIMTPELQAFIEEVSNRGGRVEHEEPEQEG